MIFNNPVEISWHIFPRTETPQAKQGVKQTVRIKPFVCMQSIINIMSLLGDDINSAGSNSSPISLRTVHDFTKFGCLFFHEHVALNNELTWAARTGRKWKV